MVSLSKNADGKAESVNALSRLQRFFGVGFALMCFWETLFVECSAKNSGIYSFVVSCLHCWLMNGWIDPQRLCCGAVVIGVLGWYFSASKKRAKRKI